MYKKIAFAAVIPVFVLALALSAPARAEAPCAKSVADVEAQWSKMKPMNMSPVDADDRDVESNLRIAKKACAKGNITGTETYLNVVRKHLEMAEHPAPHSQM